MNTTENNKLIAEFLGWNKGENYSNKFQFYEAWGEPVDQVTPEEMKFHNDWNWLMEVVEKIESLHISNRIIISYHTIINVHDNTLNDYKVIVGQQQFHNKKQCKIENTYNACTEFIKWYNSAKKDENNNNN